MGWRDGLAFVADVTVLLQISDGVHAPGDMNSFSVWLADITVIE